MKRKSVWIVASILFLGFLVFLSYWAQLTVAPFNKFWEDVFFVAIIFITILIGLLIGILGLTALLATIPFRKRKYSSKFFSLLPFISICGLLVCFYIFGYPYYMALNYGRGHSVSKTYEEIISPPGLDCTPVTNGSFELEDMIIERSGSRQIQTDKTTKQKDSFSVEWNDCEYILTPDKDTTERLLVKLTEVTNAYYKCYVIPESYYGQSATLYFVKIIK